MRFPIDLIFLDDAGTVTGIRAAMQPWRFDFTFAAAVIEASAGAAHAGGLAVGRPAPVRSAAGGGAS